jgi:hypothetical protein
MKTKLIEGKMPRADDEKIVTVLARSARDGGGNTMIIGIRNEFGDIYRGIKTVGMGEFMATVQALVDLGMTDELENEFEMKEGCDAIFK